jgi:hypothetical protein
MLDRTLALVQRAGWRVVGFAPPDPSRYLRLFAGSPATAGYWRTWTRTMPALFRKHGFAWLDFADASRLGCGPHPFVDDFHTSGACGEHMRAALDKAAARLGR